MRVRVDGERCQGHNRCYSLAPELFEVDDLGYASAAGDGTVPPELEAKARLAAANCPEYAVLIEEGSVLIEEGSVLIEEGSVLIEEGSVLIEEGSVLIEEGSVPIEEG